MKEFVNELGPQPHYINDRQWSRIQALEVDAGCIALRNLELCIAKREKLDTWFNIQKGLQNGVEFEEIVEMFGGLDELERHAGPNITSLRPLAVNESDNW